METDIWSLIIQTSIINYFIEHLLYGRLCSNSSVALKLGKGSFSGSLERGGNKE